MTETESISLILDSFFGGLLVGAFHHVLTLASEFIERR